MGREGWITRKFREPLGDDGWVSIIFTLVMTSQVHTKSKCIKLYGLNV